MEHKHSIVLAFGAAYLARNVRRNDKGSVICDSRIMVGSEDYYTRLLREPKFGAKWMSGGEFGANAIVLSLPI